MLAHVAILALFLAMQKYTRFMFGVSPYGLIYLAVYLLVVSGLLWVAGRSPRLEPHRPVVFGIFGGLLTAMPFAWAMTLLTRTR